MAGVPAICVAHGDAVDVLSRIGWIAEANGWNTLMTPAGSLDISATEELIGGVGQARPVLVFHLIRTGDEEPLDLKALQSDRDSIDDRIRKTYPSIDLRSWVIVLTGRRLESHEIEALSALRRGGRGVIATAASTSTSVSHSRQDEIAFAANIVTVLGTSPLEGEMAGIDTMWLGSASSATYSRRNLELAAGAMFINSHLANLLASTRFDEASEIGFLFLDDLDLGNEEQVDALLSSGAGGSLLSRVRFGELDFDEIPVEAWSETILGHYDMVVMYDMPLIKERIVDNAALRLDELKDGIRRKVLDDFEETGNVAASIAFCDGMYRSLSQTLRDLKAAPADAPGCDIAEDRQKLRRLTRWLPYGPAVLVRLLAAALVALVVAAFLTGDVRVPIDFTASIWPPIAATVALLLGGALYRRRYRRTVRVRDRLRNGIEEDLVIEVKEAALDAWGVTLDSLRAWIGTREAESTESTADIPETADSVTNWFTHLAMLLESISDEIRERDEMRIVRKVGSTDYAIDVPTADAVPTKDLITEGAEPSQDDVVRALVLSIRDDFLSHELRVPSLATFVDQWTERLEIAIAPTWNTLDDVLNADQTTVDDLRGTLASDLTPAGGTSPDIRHYLVAPGGKNGKVGQAIAPSADEVASGAMLSLTATRSTTAPNFAAMLHLYQLEVGVPEESQ